MCDVALDKYIEKSLDVFGSLGQIVEALCWRTQALDSHTITECVMLYSVLLIIPSPEVNPNRFSGILGYLVLQPRRLSIRDLSDSHQKSGVTLNNFIIFQDI